ncbi:diguanylate cyclase [Bradyrhizobium diazoefficiens]|nr:sensor domain-containing diguanylate cyclase [Bradyrhizobium diazoefficiens]MBR0967009.1 diguanylate cyclase [Bradyrhizobium diazoefficiens]MBR0979133.1 diguanylate cyclase [Bradyrhizobium diazoefficiens]MBR1009992.1 diguanylate cyclase [Bradyrhizobium diazoefficiens]MBR1016570.1 diguanylate cyclase [Bradyrhizobium diazoefficiens]MBR1053830.1 diguanylate cyclase [Bradyrhizobium diazoefficiens]
MASFLNDQLDFIFFFYGLAFLLLGATCSAVAKSPEAGRHWMMLAGFGFVHGIAEWLDLTALIVGDTPSFTIARITVMTVSFFLLMEFARLEAVRLGFRMPGRWIYPPLALAIALAGLVKGIVVANIAARYAAGFVGALGTGLVLACLARSLPRAAKGFIGAAAAGFAIYAIAAGLIVPAGPFWPARVVNHAAFSSLAGMPVQLVRGLLACWISYAIWAAWSQKHVADVASPRYTAYIRNQFIWTFVATGFILLSGWTLTEYLGEIYKQNVEKRAGVDIDLLASRLTGETAAIDAMVRSLAGSPSVLPLLTGGSRQEMDVGRVVLDLDVEASAAKRGYILNAAGDVVASSYQSDGHAGSSNDVAGASLLKSMTGAPDQNFVFEPGTGKHDYYVSYPIWAPDRGMVGVAVLAKSLEGFGMDLTDLGRPYFFVNPDGVILMTNRPDALRRTLWPLSEAKQAELAPLTGEAGWRPMLKGNIVDATWTDVDGEQNFVRRRFVNHTDWSLVILKPTREIFATRLLGIVITLLASIVALIYMLTKERQVHDDVLLDNRSKLQELAQDLRVKATTDPLTGLHNRLKLTFILADEIKRADRYDTPLSLVLFDIDHFKKINDTHGHLSGDHVLMQLSRVVQKLIRSNDLLARWGGEEFLILLPGADALMAFQAAEKLREAIARTSFDGIGSVTCSFGVAQYAPGDASDALIAHADAALYLAKNGGRNQVKLARRPDREIVVPLRA